MVRIMPERLLLIMFCGLMVCLLGPIGVLKHELYAQQFEPAPDYREEARREQPAGMQKDTEDSAIEKDPFGEPAEVDDPLEPVNRAAFTFNDRLHTFVLKPISEAYATVIPEGVRHAVSRAFHNIEFPIRFINCLLQGKAEESLEETGRFVTNSVFGVAGLYEVAKPAFEWESHNEDFGQTLGYYGVGHGAYLDLPILGPSSARDAVGFVADALTNPLSYLVPGLAYMVALKAGETVNDTSQRLGEYEDFKASAVDPYSAMRNAYIQYRKSQVDM